MVIKRNLMGGYQEELGVGSVCVIWWVGSLGVVGVAA